MTLPEILGRWHCRLRGHNWELIEPSRDSWLFFMVWLRGEELWYCRRCRKLEWRMALPKHPNCKCVLLPMKESDAEPE